MRLTAAQALFESFHRTLPGSREVKIARPLEALGKHREPLDLGKFVDGGALLAPRNEIPLARLHHDPQRLKFALRAAAPALILHLGAATLPDRAGQFLEPRLRGAGAPVPGRRI